MGNGVVVEPIARFVLDLPLVGARHYLQAIALVGEALKTLSEQHLPGLDLHRVCLRSATFHEALEGRDEARLQRTPVAVDAPRPAATLALVADDGPLRLDLYQAGRTPTVARVPERRRLLTPRVGPEPLSAEVCVPPPLDTCAIFSGVHAVARAALETRYHQAETLLALRIADMTAPLDPSAINWLEPLFITAKARRILPQADKEVVMLDLVCQQKDEAAFPLSIMCAAVPG